MSSARIKLPPELDGLLRTELEHCIYQANLGVEDTWLIQQYLIRRVPQEDLAQELGMTRKTLSCHISSAMNRICSAARQLHTNHP